MNMFTVILIVIFYILINNYGIRSDQTYLFEKMHKFGLGNRVFFFNDHQGYPDALPTKANPLALIRSPYESIYQGVKGENDTRVYSKRFNFRPKPMGHHVFCKGEFQCKITHLAVETTGGIPIILRGGVGHEFFDVVAKAKPGEHLVGTIRAYCRSKTDDYYKENKVKHKHNNNK